MSNSGERLSKSEGKLSNVEQCKKYIRKSELLGTKMFEFWTKEDTDEVSIKEIEVPRILESMVRERVKKRDITIKVL